MPPPVDGRVPVRRPGPLGPRGGGVYLSSTQQTRLLDAAVAVVCEGGVGRLSARRVAGYAGMSHKTFYDLFADGEDCFLAVFDRAVDDLTAALAPAWSAEGEWVARVRGALMVLLACLDRDPGLCRVVFVEALVAGPRVLARRAEVLDRVAGFLDEGRVGSRVGGELPQLTAAGIAGAAFSVIHARLLEGEREGSLLELLNPLVAMVVLPYRGPEASAREFACAVPEVPVLPERRVPFARPAADTTPRAKRSRRAVPGEPVRVGRPGARQVLNGGVLLSGGEAVDVRRVGLLRAAVEMVDEHGYAGVTVAHISGRAKVSRRTFYEVFADREDCLLAVLRGIEQQIAAELRAAGLDGLPWRERVRLGLWTVLRFFDGEPVLARFCVVESARGDDRMAAYRAELLQRVVAVIAEGGEQGLLGESLPLVAEGIAGGVVSILATRLAASSASSGAGRRAAGVRRDALAGGLLSDLLGELMGLIVIPYSGSGLALAERDRPAPVEPVVAVLPVSERGGEQGGRYLALNPERARRSSLRMTHRSALVLETVASLGGRGSGPSNLDIARHAHVSDQGQISKLLARLQRDGLLQNTGRGQARGAPNQWCLTPRGTELLRTLAQPASADRPRDDERIEAIA